MTTHEELFKEITEKFEREMNLNEHEIFLIENTLIQAIKILAREGYLKLEISNKSPETKYEKSDIFKNE